jgi:hypothetical protein
VRADSADFSTLDGRDNRARAELLAKCLEDWKAMAKA